jgi:hypothetical protein
LKALKRATCVGEELKELQPSEAFTGLANHMNEITTMSSISAHMDNCMCDIGRKADSDEASPARVPWKEEQSRGIQVTWM